jgi:hypothetical protein
MIGDVAITPLTEKLHQSTDLTDEGVAHLSSAN